MKILFFDTLKRKKIIFKALRKKMVSMYNCGPTVYDRPHIGNLRAYVFADILRRTLEFNGYRVKQIINITDVGHLTSDADTGEDKVEKSAREKKKTAFEIARYYERFFKLDIKRLNIKTPFKFPRATDHINDMINLIKILEKKGYTYKINDGIYFNTSKCKDYGKLANLKSKKNIPGVRVEFNPQKKNIHDFALWKFSPPDVKRQMEWNSPWGKGFPGWHIECSAMAMKYLGKTIDIHTGGIDHIDIHHTNEIAQSESATGKKFVNYWLHVNFLLVDGKKMSKSLGNIITLQDITERGIDPLAFRYLLLTSHYRSLINFTWNALSSAQSAYFNLLENIIAVKPLSSKDEINKIRIEKIEKIKNKILRIINNDLDTPSLIATLWEVIKSDASLSYKQKFALESDKILGLGIKEYFINLKVNIKILNLVKEREKFRRQQKWENADRIRKIVFNLGFKIEDTKEGPIIKRIFK
ncbi:MAG: cysteine--tRNA ligase [Patescibacteria group bacterium]|nr:cysteine--tRNA ligase [Patescibacteria group bacterium]